MTVGVANLATFGGRLRYARERGALSRERLAELAGVEAAQVIRLENGWTITNDLNVIHVLRLARALDVSMSWLLGDTVPSP